MRGRSLSLVPRSIDNYVTGGNERSQHISNLKYDGYILLLVSLGVIKVDAR